jgi:ABC-type dipeptide/oligopeptide/nickel transport system permease component
MLAQLLVKRLISVIFVLIGLSLITFTLSHVVASDPARLIAGPRASAESVAIIRKQYGLDRPLDEQYVTYMKGLLTLNFGVSLTTLRPVRTDLARYFPATVELSLAALVFAIVVGVPLGILSALRPNTMIDYFGRIISVSGLAIPVFWLALICQFLFFARLGWLPDGQRLPINTQPPHAITRLYTIDALLSGNLSLFATVVEHLAMPAFVLGFSVLPVITRMVRAGMLETLGLDYIRTARSKGLSERMIVVRHALRNALLPTVTVIGMQIGVLFSGAILVEIIFSWPGIGRYAITGVTNFDYNAIMAVTLIIGFIYVLMNLVVDIAYLILDPRISYS